MPRLLVATTIPRTLDDFLLPYAQHFRAKGWRVDALSGNGFEGGRAVEVFERTFAVEWSRNPLDPRNLVATPSRIRELVERESYDLVHVHTPVAAFVTRYALRTLSASRRPQVIYTAHGFHFHPAGSPVRNAIYLGIEKIAGRWTDYLVVMNREDAFAARRRRLVPEERIREMPGIGVDMACYRAANVQASDIDALRRDLGMRAEEPYLLMVAEFIPRKRHSDMLRAFALVAREPPADAAHLVLAGQGPLMAEMRSLASELGIQSRVHFLGQRRDIPALMAGAAALVLPSVQEGLPRSILEAMSMGVPVVATRIRGSTDLLDQGAGLLVSLGDVAELGAALQRVFRDPETVSEMVRTASRRIAAYDLRRVIQLHEALYGEALSRLEGQRGSAGLDSRPDVEQANRPNGRDSPGMRNG